VKNVQPSRCVMPAILALVASTSAAIAVASDDDRTYEMQWVISILAHDRGPLSDRHEGGTSVGIEAQFAPFQNKFWQFIGSPKPHLGGTFNFQGNTNVLYAGATYKYNFTSRYFINGALSLAIHDGPLHKDPIPCALNSDCGFGTRVLPRFGVDVGMHLGKGRSLMLFFDHMSQYNFLDDENEGIDHFGIRYRW